MKLNEAMIEHVRISLLRQLHASHPNSMRVSDLHLGLTIAQIAIDEDQVKSQLDALQEVDFVSTAPDPINRTIHRWRLREAGRVYLSERGLAPII
jgi:DNA-binding MarR family transcriptional regulator